MEVRPSRLMPDSIPASPLIQSRLSALPMFDTGSTSPPPVATSSTLLAGSGNNTPLPSLFSSSMLPTTSDSTSSMLSPFYNMASFPDTLPPGMPNSNMFYSALGLNTTGASLPVNNPNPLSTAPEPLPATTTPTPPTNPINMLFSNPAPTNDIPASSQISFLTAALPHFNPASNLPIPTSSTPTPVATSTPSPTPGGITNPATLAANPPNNAAASSLVQQMIGMIQQLLGGSGGAAKPPNNNLLVDAETIKTLEAASNKEGIKGKVLSNGGGPDNLIGNNDLDSIIKNGKKSGLDDKTIALAKEMKAKLSANPTVSWLSS